MLDLTFKEIPWRTALAEIRALLIELEGIQELSTFEQKYLIEIVLSSSISEEKKSTIEKMIRENRIDDLMTL